MVRKNFLRKFWLILVIASIINMYSIQAFAWGGGREGGGKEPRDRGGWSRDANNRAREVHHEVVIVGRDRYNYHDGKFFRIGWFGFEFALLAPPVGAIITTIPVGHRTILVGGTTYYYYNNIYYTTYPGGYIVVAEPVIPPVPVVVRNPAPATTVVLQPQSPALTVTINVPNSNGSYTPVTLVKKDNGYIGPQGEYYSANPTVEQLKALYGK